MSPETVQRMIDAVIGGDHPIKSAAAAFARAELSDPGHRDRDHAATFWRAGWDRAMSHGIGAVMVDESFGGQGGDLVEALLTFEGLGLGCLDAGLVFALGGHVWTVQPLIERFGTDTQKERWLRPLCTGGAIGAFSISEPDSGSDTFALTTTATPQEDGSFVINGSKTWVTMAPEADVFIVFVTTDIERGRWGVTAFVVDASLDGITVGPNRPKMGLRTTPFADVTFADCHVPADAVLGKIGAGAAMFSSVMLTERAYMLAGQIGAMERQLLDAVGWARDREQFGQPVIDFQAVSHRLADMRVRHENARLQMYRTAILELSGADTTQAASMAKLTASEGAVASAHDAMATWGARGYVSEFGVEAGLRDVAGSTVLGGTSDIQRNIIAATLEGNPPE